MRNSDLNCISEQDKIKYQKIERIEEHYLTKYYYFLKYAEDEMLQGFQTKEKIKNDWLDKWQNGRSDFDTGAERIVYALLNGKGIGQPNSCPVSSDLFFEVDDAFIHIDLKTVQTNNIGDFTTDIFVGTNQNSYKGFMKVRRQSELRPYEPSLPCYYTIKLPDGSELKKICLTYFVSILYESENLNILCVMLSCMPNGMLEPIYKSRPLKAGKNPDKTRFNFSEVPYFETLSTENDIPRLKIIYLNEKVVKNNQKYSKALKFLITMYNKQ